MEEHVSRQVLRAGRDRRELAQRPVLDVAAEEASNRRLPLLIVSMVRSLPDESARQIRWAGGGEPARELTDWRLLEAVSRVRGVHPAFEISTPRLPDADLPWRIDGTVGLPEPRLLVLGARGHRDQPAFGLGTVSPRPAPRYVLPGSRRT